MDEIETLRQEIIEKTIEYYQTKFTQKEFIPGKSRVNYAGRVFDEKELINAVDASLDFWLSEGRFSEQFADRSSCGLPNLHTTQKYSKQLLLREMESCTVKGTRCHTE